MSEPLALSILQAVKRARTLPVDFLVYKFGATDEQMDTLLQSLERQGVLRLSGDTVEFVGSEESSEPPHASPPLATAG